MNPRRLWALIALDAKLALRHKLLHVTVIVALVFGALIGFALPERVDHGGSDYLIDASTDGAMAELLGGVDEAQVFAEREELRAAVAEQGDAIGIIFEGRAEAPRATVFVQGSEGPKRLALIDTAVDTLWHTVGADPKRELPSPTELTPGAEKPPFNQMFIPIMFAVDLCLLGFMFGAVMLLQDKRSAVIAAYRVGPGTAIDYMLSKLVVNLGLSLVNLLILLGLGAPALLLEPTAYLLVLLCCAGMTTLGMGLAVFFRDVAHFFWPMALVGLLSATPMYMVFSPTAKLAWTWWVPSYHALFGAEAIFFTADASVATTALVFSATFASLSIVACTWAIHTRLLQEVA